MIEALLHGETRWLIAAPCLGLACAVVLRPGWAGIAAVGLGLVVLGAFAGPSARAAVLLAGLFLLGWWWGGARLDVLDRSELARLIGREGVARVVVTGPARRGEFSVRVPARVLHFATRELSEPVLLELPVGRSPPQGAILETSGRLRAPRGREDGFDERSWLRRQGVHAVLRGGAWQVVGRRGGLSGYADRVRGFLASGLGPGLRGERRAVLAGIVLGEDEGLSDELRDRFRASGLYHLLAVSGQNVAFIVGGMLLLAWLAGVPRWLGQLGALAAIGSYVLAVGLQPSVVRAGIAGALACLAWLAGRERDRWHFLVVGALVLLAWNPYNLLEPGFQLSFAAVATIFLAVPRVERAFEGYPLPRWLVSVIAVSLACGVATAPILWFQFHAVPLYSVLSNALAAPVVASLLGLGLGAAVLHPVLPAGAELVAAVNGMLAAYLAGVARLVGGFPWARVSSTAGLVALVLAAAVVLLAWRLPRRSRYALLTAGALALVGAVVWKTWPASPSLPPPAGLRVTFLDVGQGDSALLQVPGGSVLVDQGPPEAHVGLQLRRMGVRRLSLLVLTHPQRDHIGGAEDVLRALEVGSVLDPALPERSGDEQAALREVRRKHVRVLVARSGQTIALGRLRLRVLWPDGPGRAGEDPNDRAIVLLASYGETDVLLTADAESNVTLPLRPPPVEILKVAHHGSDDDGLDDLLALTRPRIAVVSVGAGNRYGHPTEATIATLERSPDLDLYRTDHDGRVVVESDGNRIRVRSDR